MKASYFKTLDDFIQKTTLTKTFWLLLVAEKTLFDYTLLQKSQLQCYGGIFPEIIFEQKHLCEGLIALPLQLKPILLEDISQPITHKQTLSTISSMMVLVDGLSSFIDPFLVSLFEATNKECMIFGGGAGKLTLKQEKVLFSPTHLTQDSALIIPLESKVELGVSHGWEFLQGPFVATATKNNVLEQINYENAFDIYKKIVEEDSGKKFTDENFFDLAKSYPLGIVSYSGEVVVRDPIAKDGNHLVLVGDMPEHSIIEVLKGSDTKLIQAAKNAAQQAMSSNDEKSIAIMIDCISRVLFLEDMFAKEINAVEEVLKDVPLVGILTLGEIANNAETYINFYNKTCVIGTLQGGKNVT